MNCLIKRIIPGLLSISNILSFTNAQDSLDFVSAKSNFNRPGNKILLISSMTGGTLLIGAAATLPYINKAESVNFHFDNDNSGYLQVDKLIHSFYSYTASSIWFKGLTKAGVKRGNAIIFSGAIGCLLLAPKEISDGFSKDGGFSWGDMAANAAGTALYVGQELLFNEQVIKYKFSFSRSEYADLSNGYLGKTIERSYFRDYNGHSYWLSINANKIFPVKKIPDWISLAAGYSANGMYGKYENKKVYKGVLIPETQRYRQILFSLDIDWSKINVRSKFLKTIFHGLNFIKVPFPTLEINSLGDFKGYWIYF